MFNQNGFVGQTPLTLACWNRKEKLVQLPIESGCDINRVNREGETPLEVACNSENENIVQFLLDQECDVGEKHLKAAYNRGNDKTVRLLKFFFVLNRLMVWQKHP